MSPCPSTERQIRRASPLHALLPRARKPSSRASTGVARHAHDATRTRMDFRTVILASGSMPLVAIGVFEATTRKLANWLQASRRRDERRDRRASA
jgi:hypothetical protein